MDKIGIFPEGWATSAVETRRAYLVSAFLVLSPYWVDPHRFQQRRHIIRTRERKRGSQEPWKKKTAPPHDDQVVECAISCQWTVAIPILSYLWCFVWRKGCCWRMNAIMFDSIERIVDAYSWLCRKHFWDFPFCGLCNCITNRTT